MRAHLIPTDRHYTPSHSWLALAPGDCFADYPLRAGITDIALADCGEVIAIELPAVRETVRAGHPCARLWTAARGLVTVSSAVTGRVTINNSDVVENPHLVADDPFYKGWLFAVLPAPTASSTDLLTPAHYAQSLSQG